MIKKIICFLIGHDFKETREFYGKLNNGKCCYALSFGDCERCGKKIK